MAEKTSDILNLQPGGEFFNHFFVRNPLPMWIFDSSTLNFLDVNLAATAIYGYLKEEFLAMTIKDIRPPKDIAYLEKYVQGITPTTSSGYRWVHIKKDGTCIWVNISSFAIVYNGIPARFVTVNDISKYQQQEEILNATSRELNDYKTAITASSVVSITNSSGIIEYVNDNFLALTGYSREDLLGHRHNVVNSGYHPRSFWQEMWNTVMSGETWRREVRNRKKNGELYWVDSFVIPVKNEEGKTERLFSITTDITERKNKENEITTLNKLLVSANLELTESKKELEKLSLVARLTASAVMILDKNRQIVWVNEAFTGATGYTLAEAWGKLPENLLHGNNPQVATTNVIVEAIQHKKPFHTEVTHYSKYGKESFWITDGQPVLDAEGNLLQYVLVETDITDVKEKQQVIQDSEIKLNAFFSSTTSLHLLVDHNLNVLAFNKVAEDFIRKTTNTGIAAGDYLPGKFPGVSKDNFIHFAKEALLGNATVNRQAQIDFAGDGPIWMINYLPAHDRGGNIIGCAFTAVDVTERINAENKINRQNELLKEVAWKQSHVVRAPIANILSLTTLLQNNTGDQELLAALKNETEKLDSIIRDIVNKTIEVKNEC